MKSTGIIRRIDELGRIVIPKEIRKNLKIRDGEAIEIFVQMDSIILKKHSYIENSLNYIKNLCKILNDYTNKEIIITDREQIICAGGENIKFLENDSLTKQITNIIDGRETHFFNQEVKINITNNIELKGFVAMVPIIVSADSIGLVIINNQNHLTEESKSLAKLIAKLISEQIDTL